MFYLWLNNLIDTANALDVFSVSTQICYSEYYSEYVMLSTKT